MTGKNKAGTQVPGGYRVMGKLSRWRFWQRNQDPAPTELQESHHLGLKSKKGIRTKA